MLTPHGQRVCPGCRGNRLIAFEVKDPLTGRIVRVEKQTCPTCGGVGRTDASYRPK